MNVPTGASTNSRPERTRAADWVASLDSLQHTDLQRAGGKGANLGELVRAGFPVPPGFVVTTAAYDCFVAQAGLGDAIARALSGAQGGAAIRAAFEAAPVPPALEEAILAAYRRLGAGPVAVRSSATAEDLPEAAFAGQQDTYLNIIGPEALSDAVRRCWASLWTERAIAYRERQQVDTQAVKLAVVVQRMAPAEAAGVMFTANPVTGARDETVIDASPGLGEAVVSGLVTPDHYVLRKRPWGWRVALRRAGRREVVIRPRPGGGTEHADGTADTPALPEAALARLARLGERIQRHFGRPQDVEWAWAGGRLLVLQARPVTALPPPPPRANRLQRLVASNFGEIFPIRPYPLDTDGWIPALGGAIAPVFHLLGFAWKLEGIFEADDGVVLRIRGALPRPTWRILSAPPRLAARMRRYDPLQWRADPLLAEAEARTRALEAPDPGALSWADLLAAVGAAQEIPLLAAGEIRCRYFPRAAFAMLRLRLLLGLLGRRSAMRALLSGVENKTLEVNRALEELSDMVRSGPALARLFAAYAPEELLPKLRAQSEARAFLGALDAFLDQYGHRETTLATALQPTWKDAPEVVLAVVKGFAVHPPPPEAGGASWQAARDELLRHPMLRVRPLRGAFLRVLAQARTLVQIREDTHFYGALPLPVFHRTFLEMGRRLVAAGVLEVPEDVFHLLFRELERLDGPPPAALAAELRVAATRRKRERAKLEGTPLVDPRLFYRSGPVEGALLAGSPGSPGVAEGPARVVMGGQDFDKLQPGDVLVAPHTNPSWTPLFQRAAAVVVDSGSAASHAAIVAREYGLPAVMSTVTGTQTLQDGQRVRVDGSRGAVYRAAPAEDPAA